MAEDGTEAEKTAGSTETVREPLLLQAAVFPDQASDRKKDGGVSGLGINGVEQDSEVAVAPKAGSGSTDDLIIQIGKNAIGQVSA